MGRCSVQGAPDSKVIKRDLIRSRSKTLCFKIFELAPVGRDGVVYRSGIQSCINKIDFGALYDVL